MRARVFEGLRHLGIGALSGVVTGIVVGGLGGRLAMRVSGALTSSDTVVLSTENGNIVGVITLDGTIALILFAGAAMGMVGGLLYALLRPSLAWAGRWRGLVFGALLLALAGWTTISPDNFDFLRFGPPALNALMFAALFVAFGLVVAPLYERLEAISRSPRASLAHTAVSALVWLSTLPALLATAAQLVVVVSGFLDPSAPLMERLLPTLVVGLFLVLLAALAYRPVARASYALLGIAVVAAGARTLEGIVRIMGG